MHYVLYDRKYVLEPLDLTYHSITYLNSLHGRLSCMVHMLHSPWDAIHLHWKCRNITNGIYMRGTCLEWSINLQRKHLQVSGLSVNITTKGLSAFRGRRDHWRLESHRRKVPFSFQQFSWYSPLNCNSDRYAHFSRSCIPRRTSKLANCVFRCKLPYRMRHIRMYCQEHKTLKPPVSSSNKPLKGASSGFAPTPTTTRLLSNDLPSFNITFDTCINPPQVFKF